MSIFERLKPKQYGLLNEAHLATISALYGAMVSVLIEFIVDGKDTLRPFLETPIQLVGTASGAAICAFRGEIYGLLEKVLGKEVKIEQEPTELRPINTIHIDPRTNLWNQLALRDITTKQFHEGMLALNTR